MFQKNYSKTYIKMPKGNYDNVISFYHIPYDLCTLNIGAKRGGATCRFWCSEWFTQKPTWRGAKCRVKGNAEPYNHHKNSTGMKTKFFYHYFLRAFLIWAFFPSNRKTMLFIIGVFLHGWNITIICLYTIPSFSLVSGRNR